MTTVTGGPTPWLAHGVGTRTDLPVPAPLAAAAAALALLISFAVLATAWRRPRLRSTGVPADPVSGARDGARGLRAALRAVALTVLVGVIVIGLTGPDDTRRNLAPWVVYVWVWVGVVPASLVLGPVWTTVNPLRLVHALLVRVPGLDGRRRLPDGVGCWPATIALGGWLWVELVLPGRADPPVVAALVLLWAVTGVAGACVFGPSWFDRADLLEVLSRLVGAMSPLGRRTVGSSSAVRRAPATRPALRNPLDGLDALDRTLPRPGLLAFLIVLIGGTAFDGLSRTTWWPNTIGTGPVDATIGLVVTVLAAAVVILLGTAGSPTALAADASTAFAPSLVPIAVGYTVAHYFSLLVFDGQQVAILASDPWNRGADWFGTATHVIDYTVVGTTVIALVQVGGIVAGHLVAAVVAHDRALRLVPGGAALRVQLPTLAAMVVLTAFAILLIGAG